MGPCSLSGMVLRALATQFWVKDLVRVHGLLPCSTDSVGTATPPRRAGAQAAFPLWRQQAESYVAGGAEIREDAGDDGEEWTGGHSSAATE